MYTPDKLVLALKRKGFRFFSGVPCSLLIDVLETIDHDPGITYVPAVREDAALGIASGAYLSGQRSGILIQNSGLGNIVNGLTSFNFIYHIPVLIVATWRGYQGRDAPEHILMGKIVLDLARDMGLDATVITEPIGDSVDKATEVLERDRKPAALILPPNIGRS